MQELVINNVMGDSGSICTSDPWDTGMGKGPFIMLSSNLYYVIMEAIFLYQHEQIFKFDQVKSVPQSPHPLGSKSPMSITIQNIQIAFEELGRTVDIVLHTQLGDAARLNEQKHLCLLFLGNISQVCFQFLTLPPALIHIFLC
jgi:hypothetical protein